MSKRCFFCIRMLYLTKLLVLSHNLTAIALKSMSLKGCFDAIFTTIITMIINTKSVLYGQHCFAVSWDLAFVFFYHTVGLLLACCLDLLLYVLFQLLLRLKFYLFFGCFLLAYYLHLVFCHCDLHAGEAQAWPGLFDWFNLGLSLHHIICWIRLLRRRRKSSLSIVIEVDFSKMIGVGRWLLEFSYLILLVIIISFLAIFRPKRLLNWVDINCRLRLLVHSSAIFPVIESLIPINCENVLELSCNHFSSLNIKRFSSYILFNDFPSLIYKIIAFNESSHTRRVTDLLLLDLQNAIALFNHICQKLLQSFLDSGLIKRPSLAVLHDLVYCIDQLLFLVFRRSCFLYLFSLAFLLPEQHFLQYPFLEVQDNCLAGTIGRCLFPEFSIVIRKILRGFYLT